MGWGYMRLCCHLVGSRLLIDRECLDMFRLVVITRETEPGLVGGSACSSLR